MDLNLWKNADSEMRVTYLKNRGALLFTWKRLIGKAWVPECEEVPLGELLFMLGIDADHITDLMFRDSVKYEKKSKRIEA
jgi:hypothetical protein